MKIMRLIKFFEENIEGLNRMIIKTDLILAKANRFLSIDAQFIAHKPPMKSTFVIYFYFYLIFYFHF